MEPSIQLWFCRIAAVGQTIEGIVGERCDYAACVCLLDDVASCVIFIGAGSAVRAVYHRQIT
ncbi:hypothetical protein D3C87_2010210 [compost metagenome]